MVTIVDVPLFINDIQITDCTELFDHVWDKDHRRLLRDLSLVQMQGPVELREGDGA